ncbi:SSI family serine proteinase inhibitor [Actinomadura miaoliensis]|uniref:SSI family serine proteinase inhibitor n=1 Tax=Actinomadura miaoliensis TaxID=430685 RepID=A0ABP7W0Z5_9ACTN
MCVRKTLAVIGGMVSIPLAAPSAAEATEPVGGYRLTVAPVQGAGRVASASLRCGPDGGSHPDPVRACDQLRRVNGNVARLPERPGRCTLEYAPVRVRAHGTWKGRPRDYARTYSNRCAAIRGTGGVLFKF